MTHLKPQQIMVRISLIQKRLMIFTSMMLAVILLTHSHIHYETAILVYRNRMVENELERPSRTWISHLCPHYKVKSTPVNQLPLTWATPDENTIFFTQTSCGTSLTSREVGGLMRGEVIGSTRSQPGSVVLWPGIDREKKKKSSDSLSLSSDIAYCTISIMKHMLDFIFYCITSVCQL